MKSLFLVFMIPPSIEKELLDQYRNMVFLEPNAKRTDGQGNLG